MFNELQQINHKPEPYEFYTAETLWADEHTSKQMLAYHLNESIDAASRNHAFIDRSVEWIYSYFALDEASSIADFGCGPGLYTNRLAACGAKVTGIDFSPLSISYACQIAETEKLSVNYIHANYLEYDTTDKFDLISMIMCDYCALNPKQRRNMLIKFRNFLKPDGAILLDVYSLVRFNQVEESATYKHNQLNGFWSPSDYYAYVNTFKYNNEKVILDKYTIFEENNKKSVYNWLQHFTPESLKKELLSCGFDEPELYKNVAGDAFDEQHTEFAIVAKLKSA